MRARVVPFLFLGVGAVACATATPVRGPDGEAGWYSIACRRNQGNCIEKAGEVCPEGYVTADSHGRTGFVMSANQYGAYATTTYNGEMLIKCGSAARPPLQCAVGFVVSGGRCLRAPENPEVSAATSVQKHPRFPELGATRLEAKATCDHEGGEWVDQGEKIGCKVGGATIFACGQAEDGAMRACTHWKLGADLTDERDSISEALGKPTSVEPGSKGFRVYVWERSAETVTLTGYPAGVTVTEAKRP